MEAKLRKVVNMVKECLKERLAERLMALTSLTSLTSIISLTSELAIVQYI